MRPKTLPDSESHAGKTRWSLTTIRQPESRHTPPRVKIARARFLRDGVLAQRDSLGHIDRVLQVASRLRSVGLRALATSACARLGSGGETLAPLGVAVPTSPG